MSCSCNGSIVTPTFVQHDIQRLFEDLCLGKLDFCVLAISGIDDGLAAHLCHLPPMAVEGPTADLTPADNVLHELDPAAETHRQLVKELYVLQEVVIGIATNRGTSRKKCT